MAVLTDAQARDLYPTLRHVAAALTPRDVDDLVQQAFVGLLARAELPENVAGFLATSVRNAAYDRWKHERRWHLVSLDTPIIADRLADATDVGEEATTRAALTDALAALAGEPYAPAVVGYGLGYRYRELAARGGVSIMAVKSGVNRLRHGPLARISPF
jgi:RNA polymerase sigma factor (sigma-70 family)